MAFPRYDDYSRTASCVQVSSLNLYFSSEDIKWCETNLTAAQKL